MCTSSDATITAGTAKIGNAYTLTCNTQSKLDNTKLVWYVNGIQDASAKTNKLSIAKFSSSDITSYSCKVTYSGDDPKTAIVTPVVSGVATGAEKTYSKIGEDVLMKCTAYGKLEIGSLAWEMDGDPLAATAATENLYTLTYGVAFEDARTDTVEFLSVTASSSGTLKCQYEQTTGSQELYILGKAHRSLFYSTCPPFV